MRKRPGAAGGCATAPSTDRKEAASSLALHVGRHHLHFGFRLRAPAHSDEAVRQAEAAGATILRRGEFGPGLPYVYFTDPDGYTIEVWFE